MIIKTEITRDMCIYVLYDKIANTPKKLTKKCSKKLSSFFQKKIIKFCVHNNDFQIIIIIIPAGSHDPWPYFT